MMYGAGVFNVSSAGVSMSTNGAAVISGSWNVGFTTGYISSGGDLGEAFKSGMFSALGAAVAFNIGHVIPWSGSENAIMAKMALAHGVSQGAISEMRGGNFKSGFIGGFLGKISGGLAETMFDDKVAQYIAVTMIGGAVSEAAGGDFLEGAVAAAMVHLFNDLAQPDENPLSLLHKWASRVGGTYYFGPEHPMTQDLQNSPKLQQAINEWITDGHNIGDKAFLNVESFFPIGDGMANLTRQFVGTFTASIYQLETNKIGVLLFNNTSLKSAMYHIGLPENFGRDFDLKQYYYFEEEY